MATAPRTQQAQFLQRRLARRAGASSITRLTDQYQSQIKNLTSQYETEFSRYQQQFNEMMRPYEEAMQRYSSVQMPSYEQAVAGFNEQLSAWQTQAEIAQRPPDKFGLQVGQYGGKSGYSSSTGYFYLEDMPKSSGNWSKLQGTIKSLGGQAQNFGLNVTYNEYGGLAMGARISLPSDLYYYEPDWFSPHTEGTRGTIYRRQGLPPSEFTGQQPIAPEAPEAPKIDDFDQSGFDQRRTQLQEGFQRDIAARKSARLSAVRRRSRTLLSGV
jgi:hypothetical protein